MQGDNELYSHKNVGLRETQETNFLHNGKVCRSSGTAVCLSSSLKLLGQEMLQHFYVVGSGVPQALLGSFFKDPVQICGANSDDFLLYCCLLSW